MLLKKRGIEACPGISSPTFLKRNNPFDGFVLKISGSQRLTRSFQVRRRVLFVEISKEGISCKKCYAKSYDLLELFSFHVSSSKFIWKEPELFFSLFLILLLNTLLICRIPLPKSSLILPDIHNRIPRQPFPHRHRDLQLAYLFHPEPQPYHQP